MVVVLVPPGQLKIIVLVDSMLVIPLVPMVLLPRAVCEPKPNTVQAVEPLVSQETVARPPP